MISIVLIFFAMDIVDEFLTPEQCRLITGYKRPRDQLRFFRKIGVTANVNAAKKLLVHRLALEHALGSPDNHARSNGPGKRLHIEDVK